MSTCETISIEVASAEASIGISADPITAFNFIGNLPADASFTPTPDNDILITPETASYTTEITSSKEVPIGGIVYQQGINIQVGSPSGSIVPQLLTAYKYKFENYTLENPSLFSLGDVVFFGAGTNEYNTTLTKASVSNTGFGAYNNLFIFISYTGTTLEVMHKGYLEIPDSKEWMKKYNYPTPPRSACTYCPFHNNDEWLHIKSGDPKEWQEVLEFDRFIRDKSKNKDEELFLYSKKIPLDKADFKKEDNQLDLFNNECEGMCGV